MSALGISEAHATCPLPLGGSEFPRLVSMASYRKSESSFMALVRAIGTLQKFMVDCKDDFFPRFDLVHVQHTFRAPSPHLDRERAEREK
ncbi:hypothetical protein SUGI_0440470 [Cryptomeria japonica]|nr:hypothetical protein SUGI_0440470 [Cryptomeria japonica]